MEEIVRRECCFTEENFKDLELIAQYMGHENLDQTLNYLVATKAISVKKNIDFCMGLASLEGGKK